MSEYDFISQCASDLVQQLLKLQENVSEPEQLSLHRDNFIKRCFEEYAQRGFYEIDLDYFKLLVMDLYKKQALVLYSLSL